MEMCQWAHQVPEDQRVQPDLRVKQELMDLKEKLDSKDSMGSPVTRAGWAHQVTVENKVTRELKATAFLATLVTRDQKVSVGDPAGHLMDNQVGWVRGATLASLV